MKQMINTKQLRLAEIRLFDADRMASEIPTVHAYTFLVENDGKYYNAFHGEDSFPVFERVPYSNSTLDGESFGSKIVLLQGEVNNGPCYIMSSSSGRNIFKKEEISELELKEYILRSQYFFLDRLSFLEEDSSMLFHLIQYFKIRESDLKIMDEFYRYFGDSSKKLIKK